MSNMVYIQTHLSEPARFEQLAEEAAELSQAALKLARILRAENPTPVDERVARDRVVEEYTDVHVAAMAAELLADGDIGKRKAARWAGRLQERGTDDD